VQKIFSIKETIFADFASLLTQGRAASRLQSAFGGLSWRAKIPFPRPPSFLPASLDARSAGKAVGFWKEEKRKMRLPQPSRARAFEFLLPDFN